MNERTKPIVFYDGDCEMCRSFVAGVNNPHNEMNFVSFRDVELPAQITKTQAEKEIHFIDEAGKIHRNIDAILEIWGRSRGTSWLIKLGKLPGIKHLLRLGYRLVAANRHGHRRISDSKF